MMGADLGYMGTRFIATEVAVPAAYRQLLIKAAAKDVLVTRGISGTPASFLRASIAALGLDADAFVNAAAPVAEIGQRGLRPWRDIWFAGQGVGAIADAPKVRDLVERLAVEYAAALAGAERG